MSPLQPWLHDLAIIAHGNATALSSTGGDMAPDGAGGLYVDDDRVLSRLALTVAGEPPTAVAWAARGPRAEFFGAARSLGDPGADPTVEVHRSRVLGEGVLFEEITVTSRAADRVHAALTVELAADGVPIAWVKAGQVHAPAVAPGRDGEHVVFETARHRSLIRFDPPPARLDLLPDRAVAQFDVEVEPGGSQTFRLDVAASRSKPSLFDADPGSTGVVWAAVRVTADDPRLGHVVEQSLDDLRHLLLRDPLSRDDVFAAAGSPWYLTLFGRDSIWTARLMLPFGTELAAGTLRALARRQGTVDAPERAEQPGKIPHEVRRTAYESPEGQLALPALYYGTVDATALWAILLVEAWRWGMPESEVRDLLPSLRSALAWIRGPAQPDADGFLKYLDTTGSGLANQGWKDSVDSMRFRDGRIAQAPIALVEAQAYAVEALLGAADLLDALGESGGPEARSGAAALRDRIQGAFWVENDAGRFLAMALDAAGRPIDGLGSNMGHVLGTGVLTPEQAALVAQTLTSEEMLDDFGVRTLGTGNGGFNPIGYHTGSVWTHDSAIIALGLAREGLGAQAATVARALAASGAAFDYRWPELYSGLPMMGRPAPYPASCRPQAWSAAAAGALISVALGLRADLPRGVLELRPVHPQPFGALRVDGLRLGRWTFSVALARDGTLEVTGLPAGVRIGGSA